MDFNIEGLTKEQKAFLEQPNLLFGIFLTQNGESLTLKFAPRQEVKKKLPSMEDIENEI